MRLRLLRRLHSRTLLAARAATPAAGQARPLPLNGALHAKPASKPAQNAAQPVPQPPVLPAVAQRRPAPRRLAPPQIAVRRHAMRLLAARLLTAQLRVAPPLPDGCASWAWPGIVPPSIPGHVLFLRGEGIQSPLSPTGKETRVQERRIPPSSADLFWSQIKTTRAVEDAARVVPFLRRSAA